MLSADDWMGLRIGAKIPESGLPLLVGDQSVSERVDSLAALWAALSVDDLLTD